MFTTRCLFLALSLAVSAPYLASAATADQTTVSKSCPNGEKWDADKKKCVRDPFSSDY